MQAFFLPSSTPEDIVGKLFGVFSQRHSSNEMTFDDFLELYYLLAKDDGSAESLKLRAQLYFYVFVEKGRAGPVDSFNACQLFAAGIFYFGLADNEVQQLLDKHSIIKVEDITAKKFQEIFIQEREHRLFKWFVELSRTTGLANLYEPEPGTPAVQKTEPA